MVDHTLLLAGFYYLFMFEFCQTLNEPSWQRRTILVGPTLNQPKSWHADNFAIAGNRRLLEYNTTKYKQLWHEPQVYLNAHTKKKDNFFLSFGKEPETLLHKQN